MEASTLLGAVPVGLQLWEAGGEGPAGFALRWANHEGRREEGERAARAALAGEFVDALEGTVRVRARPLDDRRVMVSFEDVADTRALADSERLNASILASLHEGLLVVDMDGRITRANQAVADLCGVALGELVGASLRDLPVHVTRHDGSPMEIGRSPVHRALAGESVRGELVRVTRRDGATLSVEVNSSPLAEADGTPYGALSTYVDVTGRMERERRIREEADTDELTGLANRRALQRGLAAALSRARARGHAVGVLMIDLDGFKAVNDGFGHAAGDAALREVAGRLRRSVRERDLVARIGGDEFVIVLPDLAVAESAAHECAARVAAAFTAPLELGAGRASRVHASVGVACFPDDDGEPEALLAAADRAMYAAKGR